MGQVNTSSSTFEVNIDNYIELAGKTNNPDYSAVFKRMESNHLNEGVPSLLKTISDNLDNDLDSVKKHLFYGKEISLDNLSKNITTSENIGNMSSFKDNQQMIDIFHGVVGVATEAGEMLKALLTYMQAGSIDLVNLGEEVGDAMWYQALILKRANLTFDKVITSNIQKLAIRFPEGFTSYKAINRDVAIERLDLEKSLK